MMHDIFKRADDANVTLQDLAAAAGVYVSTIYRMRKRDDLSRDQVLTLERALKQIERRQVALGDTGRMSGIVYRSLLALVCQKLGVDPAMAQDADPAIHIRGRDAAWRKAAEARSAAIYLMNCGLNFRQCDVAPVVGLTKQAVSRAVRRVEDWREDPDFDRMMTKLERSLIGQ